jgi:photosystem II stability/assembly factor-like uncharacterized protein
LKILDVFFIQIKRLAGLYGGKVKKNNFLFIKKILPIIIRLEIPEPMNRFFKSISILACLLLITSGIKSVASAPEGKPSGDQISRLPGFIEHLGLKRASPFRNLKWRFIGPVRMSGRVTDIAVAGGITGTILVGSASGGVWRSQNQCRSWETIFDQEASASIGDIDVSRSDPGIIWVGTGENNSSRSTISGTGVYKSKDGGKTWKHMGLSDTHHIGRIVIHPENPDIVYVAALGHLYSENRERGLYLTRDGGGTWKKILVVNESTGFIDLVMDPSNHDVLYAASWERLRKAWNLWETGPGSGIYKTDDGGSTWKKCRSGLPAEEKTGRIGIGVSQSNPDVVYALLDNHALLGKAGRRDRDPYGFKKEVVIRGVEVYRSNDRGVTWKKANQKSLDQHFRTLGYYFGQIRVDPKNENILYVLGINLIKSLDGGKTFVRIQDPKLHEDHHALWIDPENSQVLIEGNDGGIDISTDGGRIWQDIDNLPIVQLYRVSIDWQKPFRIYCSAQDHGCFMGTVTHNSLRGNFREWQEIPGGEASTIAVDPNDPNIIYSEGLYGDLIRVNRRKNRIKPIKPKSRRGEPELRCNWLTPFIISPRHPATLYFGSQFLFRSGDRGNHWQKISPDLTRNDQSKLGDVPFGTITDLSESALCPGLIYVGTDDGNIQVTGDGGKSWTLIVAGLPENMWVSRVLASRYREGRVYASLNGSRDDDFRCTLFRSADYGKTWKSIAGNLPRAPVNVVLEDPRQEKILYAGTDLGVYISFDLGGKWHLLSAGLPTLVVSDMVIHPRDRMLVAATHARGIFVLNLNSIELPEN